MTGSEIAEFAASHAGPLIVGLVLLVTGALKLINPITFAQHVAQLRIADVRHSMRIAIVAATIETTLGTALLAGCAPRYAIVITVLLLAVFTTVTLRAARAGWISDCGCYQGVIDVTPKASALLNLAYAALLLLAFFFRDGLGSLTAAIVVVVVLVASATFARITALRLMKGGKPLIDLAVLKEGRAWRAKWLPESPVDLTRGEHLVVFLGTGCPACKPWVPVLRALHSMKGGVPVLGVLAGHTPEILDFMTKESVSFPLLVTGRARFGRLAGGTPTGVHVVDGIISTRHVGTFPPRLIERIRAARDAARVESDSRDSA